MQKLIVFLFVFILGLWPVYAQNSIKVGVVDGERLFDQYNEAQEATKKIASAQDDLRSAINDSEKIYTEFEKQKKSEAEKLTKQKELQAKIDTKAQDTKKMIESLSRKIEEDILQAVKKIALQKGLDVVFDKRAVLTGGIDITDAVSEALKKKAPPAQKAENNKSKETKE